MIVLWLRAGASGSGGCWPARWRGPWARAVWGVAVFINLIFSIQFFKGKSTVATLTRIGVLSFARLHAVTMAIVGLIVGILYSFGGLIIDVLVSIGWISSAAASTPGLSFGTVLAFGALIGMPIIFATFGFIVGLIEAFLYNLFARWVGGIQIEMDFTQ